MTDEKVEEIFHAALRKGSAAERAAFLDGACGYDAALRARVDVLLQAHDEAGSFLEASAATPLKEGPGTRIGPYKLLQLIGEGGMGVVYMAEQTEPVRRKVALKIIKLGMDTKQVIARFEAERQALALMDHAHIARVFDAGATETGRPYFVMELVKGIPVGEYCDQNNLSTRARLELFLPVCAAVQHAHQKGIIHRDLKPSNILVTLHDGRPVPKVIDFGIAKATHQRLTEKTLFTEFRELVGTPEYMSPEQAEMSGLDVDTRTDIYSLGVLLYELLTSTTPFDPRTLREAGYAEFQRIIREEEPEPLSTRISAMGEKLAEVAKHRRAEPGALGRLFRGDLDWIVMRALEKDRTRRYETAGDLAADIRRHLAHEPVVAGPPGALYKLGKFVRRNRVVVTAVSLAGAALILGCALAIFGLLRARREADRSQAIADFLQEMLVSTDPEGALYEDVDVARVVATAREVFGNDHATVAATLSSRAVQLASAGNYAAAEPLHRESLRLWQDLHGADHVNVGIAYGRLGTLLRRKGDDHAAEEAFRESLRITRAQPGGPSIVTANTLSGLGEVLQNRGAYDEAEEVLRESLRIRRAEAPHQRLELALTINAIAQVMVLSGKIDEAEPTVRETLAAFRRALPPRSNVMGKVLVQIGAYYYERRVFDEAEPLLREGVDVYRASGGPSAMYRDLALTVLARIVSQRDDGSDEYVSRRLEFIAYLRSAVEENHNLLGVLLAETAGYMDDHGRPVEAIAMALEAREILTETGGDPVRLKMSRDALCCIPPKVAREPGRPAADYRTALRGAQACLADRPDAFDAVHTVGVLQYRLGQYEEALATLARSDAHHAEEPGGGLPADVAFLAMAHHRLGQAQEAQAALARLRELMRRDEHAGDEQARVLLAEAGEVLGVGER
ncbi:MAG: serine/threonine-protein kinase [Planctomycetota bacterium]